MTQLHMLFWILNNNPNLLCCMWNLMANTTLADYSGYAGTQCV